MTPLKYIIIPLAALVAASCSPDNKPVHHTPEAYTLDTPETEPDYPGATFAPNVAAPSFVIVTPAEEYQTEIGVKGREPAILVNSGSDGEVEIPLDDWHKLLAEAKGDSIYFRFALKIDGKWLGTKRDVMSAVSPYPIDNYLAYRLLYPGYELWSFIGIYQRNLTNYDQTPILDNVDFDRQCVNCHNFSSNSPKNGMMVHVRSSKSDIKGGTLIVKDGKVEKISSRFDGANHGATYPSWSRNGKFIAFSANDVGQVFHTNGSKPIEVIDKAADLMVYDVANHMAYSSDSIMGPDRIETYPNWAPGDSTIYFCSAEGYDAVNTFGPDRIQYDLCAVDFDAASGSFSNLRTLYRASADGKSATFPRVDPTGRWLMFTLSDYGCFSIWHPESQLCIMDLTTGQWREMDEVNSNSIDSYHSWDSSGRWFVFSSKRMDGLCARPYLASFDPETGRSAKPFCLPQASATFYDRFTRTFNIPELISDPVDNTDALLRTLLNDAPAAIPLHKREQAAPEP